MRALSARKYYLASIKTSVTVVLIIWLFGQIDLHRTAVQWQETEWTYLILIGLPVFLACLTINVLRWQLILKPQTMHIPFTNLAVIYIRGAFLGSFLPGGITTGDIYRMYALGKNTRDSAVSISSVLIDRVLGVFALLVLSVGALPYFLFRAKTDAFQPLLKPVILMGVILTLLVLCLLLAWRYWSEKTSWQHPLLEKVVSFLDTVPRYLAYKGVLLKVFLLALALQLLIVWWTYIVSNALHLSISLVALTITVPLISLFAMLPISLAGFGVREAGYVFFLVPFGLTPGEATSLGLISVLVQSGLRLLSGVTFLFDPHLASTGVAPYRQHTSRSESERS